MFGSIMNKVQFRLIMTLIILWLGGGIVLTAMNAGVFFSVASGQVQNYNSIKTEQLKNKLPVEGNLYMVYGLVADGYTENVDDYGNTTVSNKEYYYAVPFEDDSVLIVLVKQESKLDRQIDALYEASYGDGSDPLLMTGVPISGVLRPTESEVEQYTIEAFAEVGITDVKVESYTLDCKKSVREFVTLFWIGVALILSFVAVAVFMFIKTRSSNRTNSFAPASSAVPSGSFGSYNPNTTYPTLGSSNKYNPDMMFSSADRSSLSQEETQTGSSSGSSFGSQQNSGYPSSSQTYQPNYQQGTQSGIGYGSSFGSQQSSGYPSSSQTYQPNYQQGTQSGSGYGSSFGSQQNSGYPSSSQTYQPNYQQGTQSGSSYGSSFGSQQSSGYPSSSQTYQPKYPQGTQSGSSYGSSFGSQQNNRFGN